MLSTLKADYFSDLQIPQNKNEALKILLIDTNKSDAQLFERSLKKSNELNHIVVNVTTLPDAISSLLTDHFDAVVVGLSFSDGFNLQTIETLSMKFPMTAIIALATIKDEDLALSAIQKGAQDFIVKNSLSADALNLAIKFAIERQKSLTLINLNSPRHDYSSDRDPLTDLPNRHIFNDRLLQVLARAKRNSECVAVLFLDIDGFREIVDAFGRRLADFLLISISNKLKKVIRETDTLARSGDDQFLFILDDLGTPENAGTILKKLVAAFKQPIMIDSKKYYISASIGISLYPSDAHNATELVELANAATYQAREFGKNQFRFHSSKLNIQELAMTEQERALSKALDNNQLEIHYQPQVNLKTRMISGVHALLKWNHPEWGYLNGAEFPNIESPTLISKLNQWFFDSACQQLKKWHENGIQHLHLIVALTKYQMQDARIISVMNEAVDRCKLLASHLCFEISESDILVNWDRSMAFLKHLHSTGANLTLSHFGAEFSSIGNLRSFPLSSVKLDKSVVSDIDESHPHPKLPKALLEVVHGFNLQSIADGIETESQAEYMRQMGCQFGQGLLFDLPIIPKVSSEFAPL